MSGLGVKDGINLEGFIEIQLVNSKDNVTRTFKNTITNGGKQLFIDKCAARMLSMAGDMFGMMTCSNVLNKVGTYGSNAFGGRSAYMNRDITNVLLNLGDAANGLTANSTFLNVYDNELVNRTKLVGYANNNVVPTLDGKEGAIDYCKGEYVIDGFTCCERWKYSEGVASGTIDTIAMMPAGCIKTNTGNGIALNKCIDRVNQQYVNYGEMSTGFLIPGVSGYTANNEIMLNFTQDSNSRWKFNLTTGEVTAVALTDPFFVILNYDSSSGGYLLDMVVDGNYLYTVRQSSIPSSTSSRMTVAVYEITNNMNKIRTFDLNYGYNYEYRVGAKFLKVNSNMYVTSWTDKLRMADVQTPNKLFTLSKGSNPYYSSGTGAADFSAIGFTVPAGLDIKQVGLGNYNGQYVMFYNTPLDGETSQAESGYLSAGITFSSLASPIATATGKISGVNPNSVLFTAGSNKGILSIGFNFSSGNSDRFGDTLDFTDCMRAIHNNTNNTAAGTRINTLQTGLFLCVDNWYTDVISFVKLQTPIVKGDDDIMYVSYGYKVV